MNIVEMESSKELFLTSHLKSEQKKKKKTLLEGSRHFLLPFQFILSDISKDP